MKRLALFAAGAALVLAACGGGDGDGGSDSTPTTAGGPAGMTAEVETESVSFFPKDVRVAKGGTVTWKFADQTIHNVTADDKSFKSPNQSSGEFKHTFAATGKFKYACTLHPGMDGAVTVE